ncbi:MAG: peptidyl-prolyl cis-trans isomerase [Candidatus Aminicenantes bacterium]|nr:peptidyl-prolyl cis-trans isomerase [Candidatus Aminicenantes bacterium]
MKQITKIILAVALVMIPLALCIQATEVIEEIYAVVNGEPITYSELRNAEAEWTRNLNNQFQGEQLQEALKRMKQELMDTFIERKLLIAEAKRRDYDVENDVDVMIKEIMKQNNFNTEDELKEALRREGLTYELFRQQQKLYRMQQRLIYEEVTSKIKIDNAEIMSYYKEHINDYTLPARYDLNAVYLNPGNHSGTEVMQAKADAVLKALDSADFATVAEEYTELGTENEKNIHLGEFKAGEMDPDLEKAASGLKPGERSEWVRAESGWYLLQLVEFEPSRLVEYEEVRDQIQRILMAKRHEVKQREYLEQLKKESYIRIYKRWQ